MVVLESHAAFHALAHFREEVELDPDSVEAWVTLAHLLRLAGEVPEAIDAYETAARLAPEDERWPAAIAELRRPQPQGDPVP